MLHEDRPLLRRLLLERTTLEMARDKLGPFTKEGFGLAGKIERLTTHIEGVQGRESEAYWAEHQPVLNAAPKSSPTTQTRWSPWKYSTPPEGVPSAAGSHGSRG